MGTAFNKSREDIMLDTIDENWIFEDIIDGTTLYIERPNIKELLKKDSGFYFGKRLDLHGDTVDCELDIFFKKGYTKDSIVKHSILQFEYNLRFKEWRYSTVRLFNDGNWADFITYSQADSILGSWGLRHPKFTKNKR